MKEWWSNISNAKKGAAALISAGVFGFSIGLFSMAQIGLPARVSALEVSGGLLSNRIGVLESYQADATHERRLIGQILNWQTCAIEANAIEKSINAECGRPPQYIFGE